MTPAAPNSPEPREQASLAEAPHQPTPKQRIIAGVAIGLSRLLLSTLRVRIDRSTGFFNEGHIGQTIYCVWHNRLSLCLHLYAKHARPISTSRGLAAIVSASRDGALLASILESFGVQPIRGSSSRRGKRAFLELATWAERGYDLAITPDGPRGPRYEVQRGVVTLSQMTQLPILPVSLNLNRKLTLNSWDRFQIPAPFARWEVLLGNPIHVPRDANSVVREEIRQTLQCSLMAITRD